MLEVSFPEDLQIFLNIFCRNYCRYELKFFGVSVHESWHDWVEISRRFITHRNIELNSILLKARGALTKCHSSHLPNDASYQKSKRRTPYKYQRYALLSQ